MSDPISAVEKGVVSPILRYSDSSFTLTNSQYPSPRDSPKATPKSSRHFSIDRPNRRRPSQMELIRRQASKTRAYFNDELDPAFMSLVLMLYFFISGLIDSVAFNSWNCFVNMQTGNTVFAALGLGGQPEATHYQQYYKSLTAIGSFCLGTLFFGALHRYPTGLRNQPTSRRRGIFIISSIVQTLLIVIPAILITLNLVSHLPFRAGEFSSGIDSDDYDDDEDDEERLIIYLDLCPVALLSFQAAGQIVLSRILGVIELPTIVLSALFHDFTADLYSLRDSWRKCTGVRDFVMVHQLRQEKRLIAIVALFGGGLVGGELYKSSIGMAGAMWIGAALKFGIGIMWCFWKREQPLDDEASESDQIPR